MDRNSAAWLGLRRQITTRIEKLRDDLEMPGVDPAGLRGEITALRWVIKQVEPDAPTLEPTGLDYLQVGAPSSY